MNMTVAELLDELGAYEDTDLVFVMDETAALHAPLVRRTDGGTAAAPVAAIFMTPKQWRTAERQREADPPS